MGPKPVSYLLMPWYGLRLRNPEQPAGPLIADSIPELSITNYSQTRLPGITRAQAAGLSWFTSVTPNIESGTILREDSLWIGRRNGQITKVDNPRQAFASGDAYVDVDSSFIKNYTVDSTTEVITGLSWDFAADGRRLWCVLRSGNLIVLDPLNAGANTTLTPVNVPTPTLGILRGMVVIGNYIFVLRLDTTIARIGDGTELTSETTIGTGSSDQFDSTYALFTLPTTRTLFGLASDGDGLLAITGDRKIVRYHHDDLLWSGLRRGSPPAEPDQRKLVEIDVHLVDAGAEENVFGGIAYADLPPDPLASLPVNGESAEAKSYRFDSRAKLTGVGRLPSGGDQLGRITRFPTVAVGIWRSRGGYITPVSVARGSANRIGAPLGSSLRGRQVGDVGGLVVEDPAGSGNYTGEKFVYLPDLGVTGSQTLEIIQDRPDPLEITYLAMDIEPEDR